MNNIEFAQRFASPLGSPIRELFKYVNLPGMISFAGGYPSPSLLDSTGLMEAGLRALSDGSNALQYGATEGSAALRESLAALCSTRGVHCSADDILVTTGSQQAFDLLVRVFVEPGDMVYVEAPAYPATLQALKQAGARIKECPVDQDGLDIDQLTSFLEHVEAADRPKFLYTVPTFSNPSGTLLPQARRAALVGLAQQHGFLVVEDDPYGELSFDAPIATLFERGKLLAHQANPVIYLSSLSKTVAPGLRIGWMVAPKDVSRRCAVAKQTMDLCTSPLNQLIAVEYLKGDRYQATLTTSRAEYARRMRAMVDSLTSRLGNALSFVEPRGGMFIWAVSALALDPQKLFHAAVANNVLYVPGAAFYAIPPSSTAMRLSYAAPTVGEIEDGVERLASALLFATPQPSTCRSLTDV